MRTVLLSIVGLVLLTGSVCAEEADRNRPVTLAFSDTDVRAVLERLAELAGVALDPDDAVAGKVTLQLEQVPLLDAVRATAEAVGCEVVEQKDVLLVRPRNAPVPVRRVTFDFVREDVRNVIRAICGYAQATYVLAPDVQGKITLSVNQTPWRETLDAVLRAVGAHATTRPGNVLLMRRLPETKGKEPPVLPITIQFPDEALENVLFAIAGHARLNVAVAPDVTGTIDFTADEEPALASLRRAAGMAGLTVTEHRPGVFVVRTGR